MAHNLTINANGRAAMAYIGARPWHGLGSNLTEGASIEVWRTEAGLDWTVLASPEQYLFNGALRTAPGTVVLHRSDDGARLGTVSDGFKIVQPGEVLSFFDGLCKAQGLALETAGSLGGGRRFWALANTGRTGNAGNGHADPIGQYVLLVTGADGTLSTTAKTTATRVVCQNTLSVALSGKAEFKVSHRSVFNADAAKRALGFTVEDGNAGFDAMVATLRGLNAVKVTEPEAEAFFANLVRPLTPADAATLAPKNFASLLDAMVQDYDKQAEDKRRPRGLDDLMLAYHRAPGAMPGTARGLVEATTYYVDHVRGTDDDKRLSSAWTGQGDTLKTTAYEHAAILAELMDRPAFR